ncbi:DUF397 domain-containing protein, partial [Streptosporangium sp. NPDC004631]
VAFVIYTSGCPRPPARCRAAAVSPVENASALATNLPDTIAIRDSKNPHGPKLLLTPTQWHTFIDDIKTGEFDR